MTIHAIEGYIAVDSGMTDSEAQTAIDDWVAARAKWSGGDWDATVARLNTADDGTGTDYLKFNVRFEWSADKQNTLQKCADKFKNKVAYFALVYHECNHDAANAGDCVDEAGYYWDERWNWDDGNGMPTEVEAEVPDAPTVVDA